MTKTTAMKWMAKYVKLRDARDQGYVYGRYVKCCTCGCVLTMGTKNCQAGHFIGRGLGGGSGVYFDERNVHAQCYQCNRFRQGAPHEYELFLIEKYGQKVVDELRFLDKNQSYKGKIDAIGLMYKQMYQELKGEL